MDGLIPWAETAFLNNKDIKHEEESTCYYVAIAKLQERILLKSLPLNVDRLDKLLERLIKTRITDFINSKIIQKKRVGFCPEVKSSISHDIFSMTRTMVKSRL